MNSTVMVTLWHGNLKRTTVTMKRKAISHINVNKLHSFWPQALHKELFGWQQRHHNLTSRLNTCEELGHLYLSKG